MILASASPRRRELLGRLGLALEIRAADIDETRHEGEHPCDLVARLAREKAHAVRAEHGLGEDGLLLAADTIVWMDDAALGKPDDDNEARAMLRSLAGRTHQVSTGVCILCGEAESCFVETTDVTFYELTDAQIDAYVSSGECRDKAGAYAIQGTGSLLVESIRGDYDNVVGLPVARVVREIGRLQGSASGLLERVLEGRNA